MREVLRQKMLDGLSSPPPPLTRRDVRLPAVPGKALAVIGVRRSGKTTFLWQCLADRLAAGTPREALLLLGSRNATGSRYFARTLTLWR